MSGEELRAALDILVTAAEARIASHCTGGLDRQSYTCAWCMPLRTALDRLAALAAPSTPEPSGEYEAAWADLWEQVSSNPRYSGIELRRRIERAAPSTEPALAVRPLAEAMSDAYTYDKDEYQPDLPFVDDPAFWEPFAAKVLARLAESQT